MLQTIKQSLPTYFPELQFSFQEKERELYVCMYRHQICVSRFSFYEGDQCLAFDFHQIKSFHQWFFIEHCIEPLLSLVEFFGTKYEKDTIQFLYEPNLVYAGCFTSFRKILKKNAYINFAEDPFRRSILEQMDIVTMDDRYSWVKELVPGVIPSLSLTKETFADHLNRIRTLYPTFFSWVQANRDVYFYYCGYEGVLMPEVKNKRTLIMNEECQLSISLEEVLNDPFCLTPVLQQLEKRKRLENLYNPLMFHTSQQLSFLRYDDCIKPFFDYLLTMYSADDIEEFFASSFSSHPRIGQEKDDLFVFFVIDSYFLLDFREKTSFYVANNLQAIQQEYTRRVFSPFIERERTHKVEF